MPQNLKETIIESQAFQKGKRGILQIVFGRTMLVLVLLVLQILLMLGLATNFIQQSALIASGLTLFTACNLIYVLNTQENPSIKLSWCILMAVFPVFGPILYFFVRFDAGHRVGKRMVAKTIENTRHLIPAQKELMEHIQAEDPQLYHFASYLKQYGDSPIYANTDVQYFPLGEEKFTAMCAQLEQAEKFIFLEYFFIGESFMWDTILDILTRKAAQGVEVRVMYDGSSAVAMLPHDYPEQLKKLGIQCRVFFPFRPFISTHYNNRDHRKILVIDGHTAFTGGINIQDRYINHKTVYGHWKDTAVMVRGDAARSFTLMFLQMWHYTDMGDYTPYLIEPKPGNVAKGYVIPYADNPMDSEHIGKMVYLNILNQAQNYVYIMTPYLILDNEMVTAIRFAAKRGVDVRIILPHIPDKRTAFALAKSHYRELTEAGVRIYEYTPGFVHAKMFLCDDRQAVVGTINLDYRSLYLHFECAAYLHGVPALADIHADFVDTFRKSHLVTADEIKDRTLSAKIVTALLKVAAPLM